MYIVKEIERLFYENSLSPFRISQKLLIKESEVKTFLVQIKIDRKKKKDSELYIGFNEMKVFPNYKGKTKDFILSTLNNEVLNAYLKMISK
jgi:hypothetical protein